MSKPYTSPRTRTLRLNPVGLLALSTTGEQADSGWEAETQKRHDPLGADFEHDLWEQ